MNCVKNLAIYFGIVLLLGLFYSLALIKKYGWVEFSKYEPLNKIIVPEINFSGWNLTHFITFYIVALLFPDCIVLAFILGVFWELFEQMCGFISYKFIPNNSNSGAYGKKWINGTLNDIWYNTIGLILGYLTTKIL